jgi:hypothetical protein
MVHFLSAFNMCIILGDSLFSQLKTLSGLVMKSGLFSERIAVCADLRSQTQSIDTILFRFQLVY